MQITAPISGHLQPRMIAGNASASGSDSEFADILRQALAEVNQLQHDADRASLQLALGQIDDLHQVTILTEKAHLALQLTVAVRNKIVEAYQEISRMQV